MGPIRYSPVPQELTASSDDAVYSTAGAVVVPESGDVQHCAVVLDDRVIVFPRVIVTVVRGKHHSAVVAERIVGVAPVPARTKGVVGLF